MTNTTMNTTELRDAILNGDFEVEYMRRPRPFKADHVFDEDKTVKWNAEEVIRKNGILKKEYEEYLEKRDKMADKMYDAIIDTYVSYSGLRKEHVKKVYTYAYAESHSYGMNDVLMKLEELLDLFEDMLKDVMA